MKVSQNFAAFSEYMNFNDAISYMENIFKFYNDLPTRPRKSNVEVVLIMISSLWFVLLSSVASDSTHKLRGWDWDAPLIYSQSRTSAASLSYSHTMGWKFFFYFGRDIFLMFLLNIIITSDAGYFVPKIYFYCELRLRRYYRFFGKLLFHSANSLRQKL